MAGSAISLYINDLPFSPLNAGARATSIFDNVCHHGVPPSWGSLSSEGRCRINRLIDAPYSCLYYNKTARINKIISKISGQTLQPGKLPTRKSALMIPS
jgi:hypothetical protein